MAWWAMALACWGWGILAGVTPTMAHPDIDERVAGLTRRLAENPANASLYLRRGELHRIHGEFAAAESDYLSARRLDPGLTRIDLCVGSLFADQGRFEEAGMALGRFLAAQPGDVEGLMENARILSKLGETLEAARAWTSAIDAARAEPGPEPDWYLARSRALIDAGPGGELPERVRVEQAIASLEEGNERLGHPVALELEAMELELRLGRYDAALDRLDRISALETAGGKAGAAFGPTAQRAALLPDIAMRRARILERAGRSDEACGAYKGVLAAIEALPVGRRSAPAVASLADEARAALERARPLSCGTSR